jgi:hypothetical protein
MSGRTPEADFADRLGGRDHDQAMGHDLPTLPTDAIQQGTLGHARGGEDRVTAHDVVQVVLLVEAR